MQNELKTFLDEEDKAFLHALLSSNQKIEHWQREHDQRLIQKVVETYLSKYQIMIGNLVYNNDNEILDNNIKQVLAEIIKDKDNLTI